ncbi:50S ribosomal protein L10 [Thermodesulfobacterium hveragerdense]|uniref:50S ribosomal protein L10 n=1 Tax=Thermodesulfobacterium hveragerdense TaxID=53424 RepID=UPI00040F809E|nr:50S ribosomal protein L10 [Thermodesulfobacterium hveragerdense]
MLTRARKAEIIKDVNEKFVKSQGVFVTSFRSFTVAESNEIRRIVRERGGEFRVIKNTLIRIASENTDFKPVSDYIEGPTALVFAYQDPVEIAKVLNDFVKKHPALQIKGFVIQGKGYKPEFIEDLVKLPRREVLLAQVLGTIQAPVSNFVGVLAAIIRKFLYVLKAIEEKKSKGE